MSNLLFDSTHVTGLLQEVDKELGLQHKQQEVVVVGYSSLILGGHYGIRTEDIDVLNNRERLFYKHGFHVLDEHFMHFHITYVSRLIRVLPELANLKVFRLNNHDLFLLKFDSSRPKDITDMRYMIQEKLVDRNVCTPLFHEWVAHWYYNRRYPLYRELYRWVQTKAWNSPEVMVEGGIIANNSSSLLFLVP